MFYHMELAAKEQYKSGGRTYEIYVYRAEEDGHLRGYISVGGFGARIGEVTSDMAHDMRASGHEPVAALMEIMKGEIDAGKFKDKA